MSFYKPKSRPHLKLVYNSELPKVEPEVKRNPKLKRPKNEDVRPREHLRPEEVERLIAAAKTVGRHKQRDELLLLMMFRHGLRVSEAIALRWSDIDWEAATIYIRRMKRGNPSTHPIYPDELRMLRSFKKQTKDKTPWIFMSERGAPITDDTVRIIISRAGEIAEFDFPLHPHMLRHSCGYALAAKGTDTRRIQDYLGHNNINHTVKYTQLSPNKFDGLWD
ncbi:tyrosine-type recombinase/integrase [Nostoc sp. PA-18-2419]|uniref:tyrosine-type recombinase/integrase n=1 Tax=Nostoc sp. PA-18-2419 TaxID=2575443 RepID=UPI0011095AD0|nr:tyrosine-type recombinase/integrase [Nostoc sp. PA-18-2419]